MLKYTCTLKKFEKVRKNRKKKKNDTKLTLRASPMAYLKPILERKHPKNALLQVLYVHFLD